MTRFVIDAGVGLALVAEGIALTQLQGDALVTLDPDLARRVAGIVAVATVDDLR